MSTNFNESLRLPCDVCKNAVFLEVTCTDKAVLESVGDMVVRLKIVCSSCKQDSSTDPIPPFQHPSVTKSHLESYNILMAEMVDARMDARLEWEQATEIQSLLKTFGLSAPELDAKLANPNAATPSRGALWIVLSYESCEKIRDMLKDKMT